MSEPSSSESTLTLTTPIQYLPGVGPARATKLRKLGLRIARDILFLFPRNHTFPPPPTKVADLSEGEPATFIGTITDAELMSRTPGKSIFAAIVENDSGAVRIVFFNQPFRAEQLTFETQVRISGTPKLAGLRWEFTHPQYEIVQEGELPDEDAPGGLILANYPLTEGIKQSDLRRLARPLVNELAGQLTEVLPERLRTEAAQRLNAAGMELPGVLPGISDALRGIHLPESEAELTAAQTRLVFQELLVMQLALAMRRRSLTSELRAPSLECSATVRNRILRRFPFELTGDQRRVMDVIACDMARQFPMNRLLQGDVGSGKTVVAIFAMLVAVAGEHQATLMAPTEVLARQHYATLKRMLADSRVRIGLLCGSIGAAERRDTVEKIRTGELDIVIGTQALLYGVEFHRLGLCVIDEQHKFGVKQRVTLRDGGVDPHYLVMSATPIPRSVAMTQFGDVDLSTLREKPAGRGAVHTYLAGDSWRDRWWSFVKERVAEGRQAFVVAPRVGPEVESADEELSELIDPAEPPAEDITSVHSTYEQLRTGPLKGLRVGLLHGRMASDEKQQVMETFAEGELDVLVSTTVIEVGIDVPNATVMAILGGNRFGLAQLHQLRGRVSRGTHAGHVCVFVDGDKPPQDDERLKVFEQTLDGFELAEADFRLRGPGDVLGQRQSGDARLRIADLHRDVEILQVAREMAQDWIDQDPEMESEGLEDLKSQVLRRYGNQLDLSDGA